MVVDAGQQAEAGHVRSATFVAVAAHCCCTLAVARQGASGANAGSNLATASVTHSMRSWFV